MLRINGVAFAGTSFGGGGEGVMEVETSTPSGCCEKCMQRQGCLWSIWEASGEKKGSCYLVLSQKKIVGKKQRREAAVDAAEAGICTKQENKGTFGYSSANGEIGYVVSNGLCGMLLQEA
jgi:hypothetical protein